MSQTPLVAIRCITYNHEAYIRDALEGFVMQQTNFPFVAIVHDDASTDGTAAIIQEYEQKYPDIIKPIYETENQYSKRDGSIRRIMNAASEATGAKYYALCEGDDYWTDPLKLQKQVDFLEDHPDYSMVFGKAVVLSFTESSSSLFSHLESKEYTPIEIYRRWTIPTASVLIRKEIFSSKMYADISNYKKPVMGDISLFLICGFSGKIFCLDDTVCVYRRLSTGATTAINQNHYLFFKNRLFLANYFDRGLKEIDRKKFYHYILPCVKDIPNNPLPNLLFLIRYGWFAPTYILKRILHFPIGLINHFLISKV